MINFVRKNKQMFLFLLFGLVSISYFLLQHLTAPPHIIHIPLDDKIPFLEGFVVPYVLWYIYVPLPLVLTCFSKHKRDFYAMCILLFSGIFISLAIFAIYPTAIDFRPTSFEHKNFLTWIVQLIYENDRPTNVCPSLHCYEAVAIHVAFCRSKLIEKSRVIKAASFIMVWLVCLSTMFIKQHSAVDVVFGILLVIPTYLLTYKLIMPALDKKKKPLY